MRTTGLCNLLKPCITEDQNWQLLQPFSPVEIKAALDSMHPNKAPGCDGLNPTFFQKFWGIVGMDVTAECLRILSACEMPDNLNNTNIVLFPKREEPEKMTNLQPIALCNVVYNVIAKTLENRLKDVLNLGISESQSPFIPGHLITDNILIASEVLHNLKRK